MRGPIATVVISALNDSVLRTYVGRTKSTLLVWKERTISPASQAERHFAAELQRFSTASCVARGLHKATAKEENV